MRPGVKGDGIPFLALQDAPPFKAGSFTWLLFLRCIGREEVWKSGKKHGAWSKKQRARDRS